MTESKLIPLCKELGDVRKSHILAIIIPKEPLSAKHLFEIKKCLCKEECENLSIILHSGGGDIHVTYQIVVMLRNHCKNMTTIIPLYAKSAAVLFILGSNNIIMGELAEVGPLDTQISEREKGQIRYTSALNPFKTLEELQRYSLETLDTTVFLLLKRAELSVDEAITQAINFTSKISSPLFSQLKTEKVGEYSRALAIGKEYGERLLKRYTKWQNEEKKDEILQRFIYEYPSHDYVIDLVELKEIGFDVTVPSDPEQLIIEKIIEYLKDSFQTEIIYIRTNEED